MARFADAFAGEPCLTVPWRRGGQKLKQYIEAGGLLFLHADGGSREFNKFATELAVTLFPQYPMVDVPSEHPIYNVLYKVEPATAAEDGEQWRAVLMLYSPTDISRVLATSRRKAGRQRLSARRQPVRLRRRQARVPQPPEQPVRRRRSSAAAAGDDRRGAREIRGAVGPGARRWRRYANWFAKRTGIGINVRSVELNQLQRDSARSRYSPGLRRSR